MALISTFVFETNVTSTDLDFSNTGNAATYNVTNVNFGAVFDDVAGDNITAGDSLSLDGGQTFITISEIVRSRMEYFGAPNEGAPSVAVGDNSPLEPTYVIRLANNDVVLLPGRGMMNQINGGTPVDPNDVQSAGGLSSISVAANQFIPLSDVPRDNIISGDANTGNLNDVIDAAFVDEDGEQVDNGDALGTHSEGLNSASDSIRAGAGDDTVTAGAGLDTIDGGVGNDVIDAGADNDSVIGGTGDDSITGGTGSNTVTGGAGDDQFVFTAGEELNITDFGTGSTNANDGDNTNNDFIDLSAYYTDTTQLKADLTDDGVANQSDGSDYSSLQDITDGGASTGVTGLSALQSASDSSVAEQTGVPTTPICFTPGSQVLTPDGMKAVGDLRVDDKVQTRDNGFQSIRWIYSRHLSVNSLIRDNRFAPVLIQKDSLGEGVPERDMLVSPGHMMLTNNRAALRAWKETEALIPAQRLAGTVRGISKIMPRNGVTYVHLLFDHHEIVNADNAWTESFRPGETSLAGLGDQRHEVYEIFPELRLKSPELVFAQPGKASMPVAQTAWPGGSTDLEHFRTPGCLNKGSVSEAALRGP